MISTGTPGVIANTLRKNGAVRDVRRMAGLETASTMLGGQAALAAALGIGVRLLRQKMAAERPIRDVEIRLAARALTERVRKADLLAAKLNAILDEKVDS